MNKEELIRLHVAYIDFLEENDMRTISTSEEDGEDSRGCDCCGTRLFGPRHTMTTIKEWLFCAECQQIAVFGEIDDLTLMDISVDDYEDAMDMVDEYARLASTTEGSGSSLTIFHISTNPKIYGSDATEEDAARYANVIAKKASEEYPDTFFAIGEGVNRGIVSGIQQYINDNWTDWV